MKTVLNYSKIIFCSMLLLLCSCEEEEDLQDPNANQGQQGQQNNDPTGFRITRIQITNFPHCWSNSSPIDGQVFGDTPDVLVQVRNGTQSFFTGVDYDANQVDFTNLNWEINSKTNSTLIKILDEDILGAVSVNEELKILGFDFVDLLAENDGVYSTQIQDSFSDICYPFGNESWCRIYFEIVY